MTIAGIKAALAADLALGQVDRLVDAVDLGGGQWLYTAMSEKRILVACPDVHHCIVVPLRKDGRVRTDVLLTLQPWADPDVDRELAVREALGEAAATTLRSVLVIGVDRLILSPTGEVSKLLMRARHLAHLAGAWLPGVGPVPEHVPVPTERVPIGFQGAGSGVEEMTWGQRGIWKAMIVHDNALPLGGVKTLAPGTTVQDVADELVYLLTRFASMRTKLRFDVGDRPRQELFASGQTVLEVYDTDDDTDDDALDTGNGTDTAETLAVAVEAHYRHIPFDFRTDWPVRMAVVRRAGTPTHMVVIMQHMATDGGGAEVMIRDVATRETAPPTGMQMLEQARWQGSPEGQRHNDKAMRYMENVLRKMTPERYPAGLGDPQRPPHWEARCDSPALGLALPALAKRTGVDGAPLMLALFAVALARITGISPVVTCPIVGNRFRSALADIVCHVAHAPVFSLDVADATVTEVIERARRAGMSAFKYGYFDPEAFLATVARVSAERGVDLDISTVVNDRRGTRGADDGMPIPTADELAAARGTSVFRWVQKNSKPIERLFLTIDEVPGVVTLTVAAHTAYLSPAVIEELARGIESVAIEAVLDPDTPAGVVAPASSRTAR